MAKPNYAHAFDRFGRQGLWLFMGLLFLGIGLQKLTPYEAGAVRPYGAASPILAWCYHLWGTRGASAVFGLIEIPIGLGLISGVVRPGGWPARLGAAGATITAAITASFLVTGPGMIAGRTVLGLPLLSLSPGQLFAKDSVLFAGGLILLGESLRGGRR